MKTTISLLFVVVLGIAPTLNVPKVDEPITPLTLPRFPETFPCPPPMPKPCPPGPLL